MRSLEQIYDEIVKECLKDNCQSYRSMAIEAMRKAIEEYREYRNDLEDFSKHMKDIDPDIAEIINRDFWKLLDEPPEPNENLKELLKNDKESD